MYRSQAQQSRKPRNHAKNIKPRKNKILIRFVMWQRISWFSSVFINVCQFSWFLGWLGLAPPHDRSDKNIDLFLFRCFFDFLGFLVGWVWLRHLTDLKWISFVFLAFHVSSLFSLFSWFLVCLGLAPPPDRSDQDLVFMFFGLFRGFYWFSWVGGLGPATLQIWSDSPLHPW